MADNKKYYWLKLQDDFFKQKEIKKLRKIAGGDTYTIIYLKLQLLSLKTDGILVFEGIESNIVEELALELDEDIENVRVTWLYLEKYAVVEQINDEQFLLPKTIELIGSETSVAARVRKHRECQKMLQCNTSETNGNTEIEIDKEIEKDIKIYVSVIDYLNLKCNTKYKTSSNKTKTCIDARVNENFTLEDFKTVIDKKSLEWLNTDMAKYLRPETLFGPKFESYLNQIDTKPVQKKPANKFHNFTQSDNVDLEAMAEQRRNELKEKFNKS
ncbi:MAG: conserved phage C-terminal domain-containing protein [Sedimentibacter sp.]|uniref:conserved phage C-terminal domain-containing protein n=1 Tax=Sedimentibacter sp. TaxID=1960295 RepID=UPI0029821C4B|nr:conserved phage C-terminal domain-containing protein [Sedimentibacter sp.]MDW5300728.1 conserved phage C-terminal domain-containing protein [Sedimentibacter sp.]